MQTTYPTRTIALRAQKALQKSNPTLFQLSQRHREGNMKLVHIVKGKTLYSKLKSLKKKTTRKRKK